MKHSETRASDEGSIPFTRSLDYKGVTQAGGQKWDKKRTSLSVERRKNFLIALAITLAGIPIWIWDLSKLGVLK